MNTLVCRDEQRREAVRRHVRLCGLDYVETESDRRTLTAYFLGNAPEEWWDQGKAPNDWFERAADGKKEHIWWKKRADGKWELDPAALLPYLKVGGGQRITGLAVVKVLEFQHYEMTELDDYIRVLLDRVGDFSSYTLRVVEKGTSGQWVRHHAFDPHYDQVEFGFKAECPSDLDCKQKPVYPPEVLEEPEINYLAKDYASFRQLMLDRLALVMPEWRERHVPDLGVTLVELLAYVGDYLSYYQDAVATEAYLDTARQRASVRRHARLVDYPMHEGCNARAWVCVQTSSDPQLNARDIYFVTKLEQAGPVLTEAELRRGDLGAYLTFEPVAEGKLEFFHGHNKVDFYPWGDQECCLPTGSTKATLVGKWIEPPTPQPPTCPDQTEGKQSAVAVTAQPGGVPELRLKPGDVLILVEVIGPETGSEADADPKHRHAVRLSAVRHAKDPLNPEQALTEIEWAEEDALPFPLCLSARGPTPKCEVIANISVARGNVVLVDHGMTVFEELDPVKLKEKREACDCLGGAAETVTVPERYEPVLDNAPLTFSQPLEDGAPAVRMLAQNVRQALPSVSLTAIPGEPDDDAALFTWEELADPARVAIRLKGASQDAGEVLRGKLSGKTRALLERYDGSANVPGDLLASLKADLSALLESWSPVRDLLPSLANDAHFVAEIENEGRARLRFGDDELGRRPDAGIDFRATYRVGMGPAGNVGAKAIAHLVTRATMLSGAIEGVENLLPAMGGTAPESLAEVKLFAPHTFRKRLERAITPDDYAAIVMREFPTKVQRAAAQLRWNGSWQEVLVAIDAKGRDVAGPELLAAIDVMLQRYRRIGHDVVVRSARRVPLDLALHVCARPGYLRGHIKAALLDVFSNRILPDGRLGFFHPDNLSFSDGIYLSKVVALAQGVTGVESVTVKSFQRLDEPSQGEIENGVLPLGSLEVACLDNDPSFPENGRLRIEVGGGR